MPSSRFEPSSIKNKIKRESETHKRKRLKTKAKLSKRLAQAKLEASDPAAKKKRLAENIPRTLDNTREFDPSFLTANPSAPTQSSTSSENTQEQPDETTLDLLHDFSQTYFSPTSAHDPTTPPRVLITTGPKSSKGTYDFCDELVGVLPGAEFVRRKKSGRGFELGRIAGWAAGRGYKHLVVVNEDMKKTNAITLVHLPAGPTAYFKLTSIQLTKQIFGHARATPHNPELVLNGFVTRLGHTVGRMFQTLFPPMPHFEGRQVVTLHNQRDFLFFRRHRYAFRSPEKVALQEIGPRFTLKLRSLRKGLPAVKNYGEDKQGLEFDDGVDGDARSDEEEDDDEDEDAVEDAPRDDGDVDVDMDVHMVTGDVEPPHTEDGDAGEETPAASTDESTKKKTKKKGKKETKVIPPKKDEFLWAWKPELETTRRTFFL